MSLAPGSRLGVYAITAQIGEGGMGRVFRATDTKLKRQVAIKILPPSLATDPDRLARFQREAEVLASLNHPNIAAIYGVEESEGMTALVMELVEGEDLSHRIARGAMPLDEALPIAKQIAEALEAAHEQGLIHRDLKPANIKVRPDGTVKVLDFGLAKAMEPAGAILANGSQGPTMTTPALTEIGAILGTAAYMAPEQARGNPVDKRADIWAFGCVFYEMLAGHFAFHGATASDTIAAVLTREPDWSELAPDIPGFVTHLVKRCLRKDRNTRLRDIGDARIQIEEVIGGQLAAPPPVSELASTARPGMRRHARWLIPGTVTLAVTAVLGYVWSTYLHSSQSDRRVEFGLVLEHSAYASLPRVSPDGSTIVYSATDSAGRRQLWLRRLDSAVATPVRGTDDALYPFWSPDGRWIGFYAQPKLRRISREGGSPQTLATLSGFDGTAAWSSTGEILYAPGNRAALYRIADSGGMPQQVTTLDQSRGENSHRQVRFLPDGRHFLFSARSANRDNNALYSGSIDSRNTRRLFSVQSNVAYVPPGHGQEGMLLFVLDSVLYWQRFDGVALSGEPVRLMDVAYRAISMQALFDVSMDGHLLISGIPSATTQHLTWFDRDGRSMGTLGPAGQFEQPRISPEGGRVVFNRPDENGGNRDLWIIEIGRGVASRLTSTPANEWSQFFTSDGRRLLFASDRDGHQVGNAWEKTSMDPGAGERPIDGLPDWANPEDITIDGRWVAFVNGATHSEIWIAPTFGGKKPFRFLDSGFDDRTPRFSPDGKWIAYHSNESGRFEIYVRPFSGTPAVSGEKKQISLQGGFYATWSRDGRELFYLGLDSKLYAAQMRAFDGASPVPAPRPLFATCAGSAPTGSATQGSGFDASRDGSRFLFACSDEINDRYLVKVNWQGQP